MSLSYEESLKKLLENENVKFNKKLLGISIRSWKECDEAFWTSFSQQIDKICEKYDLEWIKVLEKNEVLGYNIIIEHSV